MGYKLEPLASESQEISMDISTQHLEKEKKTKSQKEKEAIINAPPWENKKKKEQENSPASKPKEEVKVSKKP